VDVNPDCVYVGCDPGVKGAVAAIYGAAGQRAEAWYTPMLKPGYDLRGMLKLLYPFQKLKQAGWKVLVGVERQGARPTDPKNTVFKVGRAQALWEMAAVANGLEYELVSPLSWKRRYVAAGASKQASITAAQAIYPDMKFPLKKSEALAEALLIADFVMRKDLELNYPYSRKKVK
jgi:hypothetical protein